MASSERISAVVDRSGTTWKVSIDPETGLGHVYRRDGGVWVWVTPCEVLQDDGRLDGRAELDEALWSALETGLRTALQADEEADCHLCGRTLPLVVDAHSDDVCLLAPRAAGRPTCGRCLTARSLW